MRIKKIITGVPLWLAASLILLVGAQSLQAEWKLESEDGNSSIKLGFLIQARAEATDAASGDETSKDLYFRRLRLLFGGKLSEKWTFFFETDSPNLGKALPDGSKSASDIFIQDFFVTYNHSDAFKVDIGMILIPLSHNSQQSAATLLPVDYGPYSFLNSAPTTSRVGRDYGVQLRGFLANDLVEYRAGVFQGARGEGSTNDLRYVGRVVFYPFEADKGFYYTGTTLGKKKILALGLGFDHQEDYDAYAVDAFYDQPLGTGNGLTLQGGLIHYDGGKTFPQLPEQDVLQLEVGYYCGRRNLMPFLAYYQRDFDRPGWADEERFQVGLAYYMKGYNRNLKLSYGQLGKDGSPDRDQLLLQLQILHY